MYEATKFLTFCFLDGSPWIDGEIFLLDQSLRGSEGHQAK